MNHPGSGRRKLPTAGERQRILVACDRLVLSGGLLRIERAGRHLAAWGNSIAYLAFESIDSSQFDTDFPVLTYDQAADQSWNCIIVPGAGFSRVMIDSLSKFRTENFGTRVQLVLNDMSRRDRFLSVNQSLCPHVVVFNNHAWTPGSFTDLFADKFFFLEGAVDTTRFRPLPYRSNAQKHRWLVGGLANKNPAPLIEAMRLLPDGFMLHFFGHDLFDLRSIAPDLVASGRLTLLGPILGDDLTRFYDTIDFVCMTEENAGWSNLVAEGLASGLPVVCTRHGTSAFARDGTTAIVMSTPSPAEIADHLRRLAGDAQLRERLGRAGRAAIEPFDWSDYAARLLSIIRSHDGTTHYYHAPEVGLHGKWPPLERLSGLEDLLARCNGYSILDLGAAEGLIARTFLDRGAALVHGFEIDSDRTALASTLVRDWPDSLIRNADVSNWNVFTRSNADLLLTKYDIVLYLGLHQHLPDPSRRAVLEGAAARTRRYLAVRGPQAQAEIEDVDSSLRKLGLTSFGIFDPPEGSRMGQLRIYRRDNP